MIRFYNLTNVQIGKLMCAGYFLGVMTVAGAGLVYAGLRPAPEVDYRMEAGCKMPSTEGEVTVAVIYEGKFFCWRHR